MNAKNAKPIVFLNTLSAPFHLEECIKGRLSAESKMPYQSATLNMVQDGAQESDAAGCGLMPWPSHLHITQASSRSWIYRARGQGV